MYLFKNISIEENKALLKFPACLSMLAAVKNDSLDYIEKKVAIKFVHTKTFTSNRLLSGFYKEADKVFEKTIEQLDKDLPKEKELRQKAIEKNY